MVRDILHRLAREGNFDEATLKQRSRWSKGSTVWILAEIHSRKGNAQVQRL